MQNIQYTTIEFKDKISVLFCPECESSDIIWNREGFNVCRKCGTVLNIPNFEKRPLIKRNYWTSNMSFYELSNRTTIGTKLERGNMYEKALHYSQSESDKYQTTKTIQAFQEVSRLCSCLDISDDVRDHVMYVYHKIRNTIQKYSLGQQIPIIIPVILFRVLKCRGSKIPMKEIHHHMKCNPEQFRRILSETYHNVLI